MNCRLGLVLIAALCAASLKDAAALGVPGYPTANAMCIAKSLLPRDRSLTPEVVAEFAAGAVCPRGDLLYMSPSAVPPEIGAVAPSWPLRQTVVISPNRPAAVITPALGPGSSALSDGLDPWVTPAHLYLVSDSPRSRGCYPAHFVSPKDNGTLTLRASVEKTGTISNATTFGVAQQNDAVPLSDFDVAYNAFSSCIEGMIHARPANYNGKPLQSAIFFKLLFRFRQKSISPEPQ